MQGSTPPLCPDVNPRRVPAWLWLVAPAVFALAALIGCIRVEDSWESLGILHLKPYFSDLVAVLAASDAHAAGLDPYLSPSPFDPSGRPHVYGPWWLYLHELGLTRKDATWAGALLVVFSTALLAWVLRPRDWRQSLLATALMLSPPLLLAYERANNDLVIFVMLVLVGIAGPGTLGLIIQASLIWLASVLKFYPIAALPILAYQTNWPKAVITTAMVILALAGVVYLWHSDFTHAISLLPKPDTSYGYGFSIIITLIRDRLPQIIGKAAIISGLVVGVGAVIGSGGFNNHLQRAIAESDVVRWFLAGGLTWTSCYFSAISFPYRVILLLLVASAWFRIWQKGAKPASSYARSMLILLALMVWLRLPSVQLVFLAPDNRYLLGVFGLGVEHGIALGLSLVVLYGMITLGWLQLCAWRQASCQEITGTT